MSAPSLLIVGPEVVRNDVGVVEVSGEHELEGDRAVPAFAMVLARDRERADIGEATGVEVSCGSSEHLVTVEVEELDRVRDAQAQARARDLPPRDERRLDRLDRLLMTAEPVPGTA